MTELSIGEVARRAGINASAIRYYEKVGLLEEPRRVGGRRRYDPKVIQRLGLIEAAKRAGLTIKETYTLLHGFPIEAAASERWQSLATRKLEEVDKLIAQLEQMKTLLAEALRCECASLDECAQLLVETQGQFVSLSQTGSLVGDIDHLKFGRATTLWVRLHPLFPTKYCPPQLKLFALEEALGEGGWLKALGLDGYAARSPSKPEMLQEVLFSYLEAL